MLHVLQELPNDKRYRKMMTTVGGVAENGMLQQLGGSAAVGTVHAVQNEHTITELHVSQICIVFGMLNASRRPDAKVIHGINYYCLCFSTCKSRSNIGRIQMLARMPLRLSFLTPAQEWWLLLVVYSSQSMFVLTRPLMLPTMTNNKRNTSWTAEAMRKVTDLISLSFNEAQCIL